MKNIFKLLFASLFVVNFSCHDSENVIDGVLDYETGAILRTISVDNAVLNSSDENSPITTDNKPPIIENNTIFSIFSTYNIEQAIYIMYYKNALSGK